ncbi:MAG TPA: hypothetical protein VFJ58_17850 [Armatimonadota bacterium]|nr:hypothetical protein [Armatimonadota bacterium]
MPNPTIQSPRSIRQPTEGRPRAKQSENSEVDAYIRQHPGVKPLLVEAREKVRQYFGAEASFNARVRVDPESECPWLYGDIRVDKARWDDAVDALARLDDEWWLDAKAAADAPMTLLLNHD